LKSLTPNEAPLQAMWERAPLRQAQGRLFPVQAEPKLGKFSPLCHARLATVLCVLLLSAFAAAETLTGTVKNGTTDKPAAGDDVVLIKLAQGMEEGARTKTDSKGKFSFNLDNQGPHLIRAIHQGVTYHHMAPPGTTSVEMDVYDAAKKVENISVTADVMRIQAEDNQLEVIRLFAVNNASSPARTQMNDHNFEFFLPEGAKIDQSMAKTANGQPINSAPVPQAEKNRYAFIFPLRPGQTEFQVAFHLPYSGQASLDPKLLYPAEHFVVMLPKSMQFTPGPNTPFQSMQDPQQSDSVVQVASRTQMGQSLAFKVSGAGVLQSEQAGSSGGGGGGGGTMGPQGRDSRPGGGLGPPIDAPDPLQKYRWYILGGFALVMAVGAVYVATRQQSTARASAAGAGAADLDMPVTETPRSTRKSRSAAGRPPSVESATAVEPPASSGHSSMLLAALKEEIFQLEVEHKQGRISQAEYEKAKAALDQTLERAVKREAQKV
jgi:hypothetical protein